MPGPAASALENGGDLGEECRAGFGRAENLVEAGIDPSEGRVAKPVEQSDPA